ncbi:serine/threonine-protein kinase [Myxococcus sp. AB036A]|uniref:serine/threonine-protein kinase n=1 Tax=Myxococcus sp. AB036A TaxID=2562793 RepID=UPI0011478B5E|nr:serine/threonine-protein kinase [Myxococcus sp. AB036A]
MDLDSKSSSLPLTAQHRGAVIPPDGSWEVNYAIGDSIGRGGYGEVFKARDKRDDSTVALKISHESSEQLRRFRREIEALQRLRHRNVIEILEFGDGWYTMPFAEGSLTDLAPELGDEELIEVVTHAAQGLAAVHAAYPAHRDVTPNNILRIGDRWLISDFGLVRKPQGMSSDPKTEGHFGTRGYIAPEIMSVGAHEADSRADVYSLGQVARFITTAKPPQDRAPTSVSPVWGAFITKMTMTARNERFQTMEEVVAALDDVRRRLKAQRRAAWEVAQKMEMEVGVPPDEVMVLKLILEEFDEEFSEQSLIRIAPQGKRAFFRLSLRGLQGRRFLEAVVGNNGEPWGLRLTQTAFDWCVANRALLDACPLPTNPMPQGVSDDDIPF